MSDPWRPRGLQYWSAHHCEIAGGEEGRTAIHPRVEELDLGPSLLVFTANKAIALIDTLGGVNGEDLYAESAYLPSRVTA